MTLSTQSAGCEQADLIGDTPLLLLHGDADELLPPMASEMVRMIAGTGELVILPGAGHLLREAGEELRRRLGSWIPDRFARPPESEPSPRASPAFGPDFGRAAG